LTAKGNETDYRLDGMDRELPPNKSTAVYLSVVIPVHNEAENLLPLLDELESILEGLGRSFEILIVDDGSDDSSFSLVKERTSQSERLRGLRLSHNLGQTAALQAGFDHSRGAFVVTMDGDLQNDPAEIEKLLAALEEGFDIACGWRKDRRDRTLDRVIPSKIANKVIGLLTGSALHDHGCALKAFRREILSEANLYADMHRFVVPILGLTGVRYKEVVVNHRERRSGKSHYGLARVKAVLLDLFTLALLTRFNRNPLMFFAVLSLPFLVLAGACLVASGLQFLASDTGSSLPIVLPTISMLLTFEFANLVVAGIAAELILWASEMDDSQFAIQLVPVQATNGEETYV